jgi:hypothetical protein
VAVNTSLKQETVFYGEKMKIAKLILICTFSLILASEALSAEPLTTGFISNDAGEKCWYTQTKKEQNAHFHGQFKGTNWIIVFDEKTCMGDSGLGLDVNKMMINNIVSKWYSHSDAKFATRASEMYSGSLMQEKGECIQSKTYPMIGITVDYLIDNESITGVVHGASIQGCTKE